MVRHILASDGPLRFSSGFGIFDNDLDLMAVLELRYHNPCGDDTEEGNAKIETDAHKVVGIAFGLHSSQG